MKKKKLLLTILCACGGVMIGYFSNHLTEVYGCIAFGVGVGLLVYSAINLNE